MLAATTLVLNGGGDEAWQVLRSWQQKTNRKWKNIFIICIKWGTANKHLTYSNYSSYSYAYFISYYYYYFLIIVATATCVYHIVVAVAIIIMIIFVLLLHT